MDYLCFLLNYLFQSTDEEIVSEVNPIKKTDIKVEHEEFCLTNDEEIVNEMNPIENTDIKVESEKFFHVNNVLGNYDGVMWMIIFVNILRIFCCCFYVSFSVDMFSYSIKYSLLN